MAGNLAPLPSDRQYELWVFQDGKPVTAGVFDVDPQGRALFESTDFPPSRRPQNFAVTDRAARRRARADGPDRAGRRPA